MNIRIAKDINSEERHYLRMKWEFMRRDSAYKTAWNKAKSARKKFGCPVGIPETEDECSRLQDYFSSSKCAEEDSLSQIFGLYGCLIDSDLTFDNLSFEDRCALTVGPFGMTAIHCLDYDFMHENLMWLRHLAPKDVVSDAYSRTKNAMNDDVDGQSINSISIKIDFSKVRSIDNLKKDLAALIDDAWTARLLCKCSNIEDVVSKVAKKFPRSKKKGEDATNLLGFDERHLPVNTANVLRKIANGKIVINNDKMQNDDLFKKTADFEEILKIGDIYRDVLSKHPEYSAGNTKYPGLLIDAIRRERGLDDNKSTDSANETIRKRIGQYLDLTNGGWRTLKYP